MMNPSRSALIRITIISCIVIIIGPVIFAQSAVGNKIRQDVSLVAPGIGSHGILIGDDIDSVMQMSGKVKFKLSKPASPAELFKDVFHVSSNIKIFFDYLLHDENSNYTLCVSQSKVVAVIGFVNNTITTEGVSLKSGVNSFIFNYGNANVLRIQSGSHGLYIYKARGIAVIDDDMNDSIDLYIVFLPQQGE
jgi:hypothetical protein